jgi:hypothetical protein
VRCDDRGWRGDQSRPRLQTDQRVLRSRITESKLRTLRIDGDKQGRLDVEDEIRTQIRVQIGRDLPLTVLVLGKDKSKRIERSEGIRFALQPEQRPILRRILVHVLGRGICEGSRIAVQNDGTRSVKHISAVKTAIQRLIGSDIRGKRSLFIHHQVASPAHRARDNGLI